MKKSNMSILLLIGFVSIICILYYYICKKNTITIQEPFFPAINKFYRPYIRNTRLYSSAKINSIQNWLSKRLRLIGIL